MPTSRRHVAYTFLIGKYRNNKNTALALEYNLITPYHFMPHYIDGNEFQTALSLLTSPHLTTTMDSTSNSNSSKYRPAPQKFLRTNESNKAANPSQRARRDAAEKEKPSEVSINTTPKTPN